MVRRPAAEAAWLAVDQHVPDSWLLGLCVLGAVEGDCNGEQQGRREDHVVILAGRIAVRNALAIGQGREEVAKDGETSGPLATRQAIGIG